MALVARLRFGARQSARQPSYDLAGDVTVWVEYRDSETNALTGAAGVAFAVTKADGSILSPAPSVVTEQAGIYRCVFTPDQPGLWAIEASSTTGGATNDRREFLMVSDAIPPSVIGPTAVTSVDGFPGPAVTTRKIRRDVRDFGVVGDGIADDTAAIQGICETGGTYYFPDGDYRIAYAGSDAGGVQAIVTSHLDILCAPGAEFVTDATGAAWSGGTAPFGVDNDMIRLSVPSDGAGLPAGGVKITWRGGVFRQRNQPGSTSMPFRIEYPPINQGASGTTSGLSIRGSYGTTGLPAGNVTFTGTNGTTIPSGTRMLSDEGEVYVTTAVGTISSGTVTVAARAFIDTAGPLVAGDILTTEATISGVNATVTVATGGLVATQEQNNGIALCVIEDVEFDAGDHWETAGGDEGIFISGCAIATVARCTFRGSRDLGIYGSSGANDDANGGGRLIVRDNLFLNCFGGVSAKRNLDAAIFQGNEFVNCVIAMALSPITTSSDDAVIADNMIRCCSIGVRLSSAERVKAYGNSWRGIGALLADGETPADMYGQIGYWLQGARHCVIYGERSMEVPPGYDNGGVFVLLADSTVSSITPGNPSEYNVIENMRSFNHGRVVEELTGQGAYNEIRYCVNDGTLGVRDPIRGGTTTAVVRWSRSFDAPIHTNGIGFTDGTDALPSLFRLGQRTVGIRFDTNAVVMTAPLFATFPGPFANDAAAATGGVAVGQAYRRTSDNLVVVRAA